MKKKHMFLSSLILAAIVFCTSCGGSQPVENLGLECPQWEAQWIAAPWEGDRFDVETYDKAAANILAGAVDTTVAAPEFRTVAVLKKRVRKATAYFCGLGFGELFIGGKKVGTDLLSPNLTSYCYRDSIGGSELLDGTHFRDYRILYLSYDVSRLLHRGRNEIGALVGCGFYAKNYAGYAAFGTRRMICQIDVEFADGSTQRICSGPDWQVRRSGILLDDLFRGEVFDARYSGPWQDVAVKEPHRSHFMPQDGPTDKVMELLAPQTIEKLEDGSWRVDFGDYITGSVALKGFKAPAGIEIEIVHECETRGNGTWRYISDGQTRDYAPRFTWYAFRTAVVKGWPGELKAGDLEARVIYSNMKTTGRFECSNPLLNRIFRIWWRTQADNMHLGTASDCPHREKRPYTGDGEVSCVTVMHTFDAQAFYRKWIRDMRDSQDTLSGYVPNVAPWLGGGGGVPWGSAICIMPWEHYLHYGDKGILEENYEAMKEYLRWLSVWQYPDGTIHQKKCRLGEDKPFYWFNLGEWCPPYGLVGENLIHSWYWWRCASITASCAAVLGLEEEGAAYAALAERIKAAFHAKFWNPLSGSYESGSGIRDRSGYGTGDAEGMGNGSNIFALAMGVPEDRLDRVLETVKAEFEANGGHLNTGIFGTSLLGETLCRYGLDEYVYTAMTKTDFPSFGYWIEQGADTFWEQWSGKASRNHPMFGGALTWLFRCLAGINTDEAEPGYRHVIISPRPVGDLKWVDCSVATPGGMVSVKWERSEDGLFGIDLEIPPTCRATLILPGSGEGIDAVSGHYSCAIEK
ncbi:MAG: alpha-L-rhamnosidase N-terminal domain-containing protein [Bacteroidales bacterium]|nr:alpha-L-rhamnosidase N-terminal domain-containing protein [Bacteroidales bacterium]